MLKPDRNVTPDQHFIANCLVLCWSYFSLCFYIPFSSAWNIVGLVGFTLSLPYKCSSGFRVFWQTTKVGQNTGATLQTRAQRNNGRGKNEGIIEDRTADGCDVGNCMKIWRKEIEQTLTTCSAKADYCSGHMFNIIIFEYDFFTEWNSRLIHYFNEWKLKNVFSAFHIAFCHTHNQRNHVLFLIILLWKNILRQ